MADVHAKERRSYNMSKIRSSDTKPELKIRALMKKLGFSYQPKNIYGRPDFAHRRQKIAVFIDGCFWHRCKKHFIAPKQNESFWSEKIERNVARDKEVNKRLKNTGWRVIRVWEHDIKKIR